MYLNWTELNWISERKTKGKEKREKRGKEREKKGKEIGKKEKERKNE